MEYVESSITPRDAQMLSGRLFTRSEVASLYGVPAILVEAEEKGEGKDREEARSQFYSDCLPPLLGPIAEDLNRQILEEEYGLDAYFYEFPLDVKLKGAVEERYKSLVSAAGGPILTRNEARARENLPDVEGGDDLITPLNVVAGKPSTDVMPPQDAIGPDQEGGPEPESLNGHGDRALAIEAAVMLERRQAQADRRDRYAAEHRDLLSQHFARQERSFKSSKKFDLERWNSELAADLEAKAIATVEREGGIAAERLAMAGGFDIELCRNYLRAGAAERAQAINQTTANRIEETSAVAAGLRPKAEEEEEERPGAFSDRDDRAAQGGLAIATAHSAFAHQEAGKQSPTPRVKTWIVMSGNSRHPQMNGATAPVGQAFSNGAQYPGDPNLGVEETARCQCLIEVS